MCLFVMLTNNLFNNPFHIFKEDLGQDELPAHSGISLSFFLELLLVSVFSPSESGSGCGAFSHFFFHKVLAPGSSGEEESFLRPFPA